MDLLVVPLNPVEQQVEVDHRVLQALEDKQALPRLLVLKLQDQEVEVDPLLQLQQVVGLRQVKPQER